VKEGPDVDIKVGARFRSTVCDAEVIVVRSPGGDLDLRCGGHPMVAKDTAAGSAGAPKAGFDGGTAGGKRYADQERGLELLATKAGTGSLSVGDEPLPLKDAKPLPASD
jgi:hypothetical protein